MKKIFLIVCFFLLCGCSSDSSPLKKGQYHSPSLKEYNDHQAIDEYKGDHLDAKLIDIGRYVNDQGEYYYEMKIYIKPNTVMDSKSLHINILKDDFLKNYYAGKEIQAAYNEVIYPLYHTDKEVVCFELEFTIFAEESSDSDFETWKQSIEETKIQLSWGNKKEKINFDISVDHEYAGFITSPKMYFGNLTP